MLLAYLQAEMMKAKTPAHPVETTALPVIVISTQHLSIIDSDGILHTATNEEFFPLSKISVDKWWPVVKAKHIVKSEPCPHFEEMMALFPYFEQAPKFEWRDSGWRDACGITCYGVYGNYTWILQERGCMNTVNTQYPEIDIFVQKVYEVLDLVDEANQYL
jgi:hypothetical protein